MIAQTACGARRFLFSTSSMAKRSFAAFKFSEDDLPTLKSEVKTVAAMPGLGGDESLNKRPRANRAHKEAHPSARTGDNKQQIEEAPVGHDVLTEQGEADATMDIFVAPAPAKYRERYRNVCDECFNNSLPCQHFPEKPLRLLLLGHNPSEHAWKSGYLYSNPTNRMMRLLTGESIGKNAPPYRGVLPHGTPIEAQNIMPGTYGIGLTDLGLEPGNNAADYSKRKMIEWASGLYKRLSAHQKRAGAAPDLVAFTGKRQFRMIFPKDVGKVDHGEWKQKMPSGWPFPPSTRIWVLPSSSGRAVMTQEQRLTPYKELADAYHK